MIRAPLRFALVVAAGAGCQDSVTTPFPPGLEPLEANVVAVQQGGAYTEVLRTASSDTDYIRIYARGYVLVSPGVLWAATKDPEAMVATCSTSEHMVTPANDPGYEFSFLVHYIVHNVLTVEWDDQWRYGVIEGSIDAPTLGMIKHQKTQGSDFIHLSEGTVQVLATDDPNVAELSFVEHLDAVSASVADVMKGVQHNYDALVATAHGNPLPACP
jgi:hypothetical protein